MMRYTEIEFSFPIVKFLPLPSAEELRELFDYDVLRGELLYRKSPPNQIPIGSIAGGMHKKGYRQIKINNKSYKGHRLIWKWFYGIDPAGDLDHRDQEDLPIKQNHIWHLRDLTRREHTIVTGAHRKGSDLPAGVSLHCGRYQVKITQDGRQVYLGRYDTPEEASQAYLDALQVIENGDQVVSPAKPTSSQYKGVSWDKASQKWMAEIAVDGKRKYLGRFSTELEAHQAVCKARSVS